MHHAYLLERSLLERKSLETSARRLFGFTKENDPDVHIYVYEKLNIEEARGLAAEAAFRSVSGRALFIIAAGSISHDAQQALLKLFEEPQEGTTFVLLAPRGMLIPTLRSRFIEYPEQIEEESGALSAAKKFLASAGKERSMQIATLLKEEEMVKDRVRDFLDAVEAILYKKSKAPEMRAGLEDVALVRRYLGDRSASLKMLLEHLAVALPTV